MISPAALDLLRDLARTKGAARIGRRGRALKSLQRAGLVRWAPGADLSERRGYWPPTDLGRAELVAHEDGVRAHQRHAARARG